MCVINFNIIATGTTPVAAEARYRLLNSGGVWTTFTPDLAGSVTPDITVNGTYELQVRVEYGDGSFSDWTISSTFTVGNCTQLGNIYAVIAPGTNCDSLGVGDFNTVLFSNDIDSGQTCYTPLVGHYLYKDSDLLIPADAGRYLSYGVFNGCHHIKKGIVVNSLGLVTNVITCLATI